VNPTAHFEVVDALGLCELVKRSPTLDGSVPLRVAQGCVPLLDGNAFGVQLRLRHAWRARRVFGRWRITPVAPHDTVAGWGLALTPSTARTHEDIEALLRARTTTLVARGWLRPRGVWHQRMERGVVHVDGDTVRLVTGLLVRASPECVLRVARAANRRSLSYDVRDLCFTDATHYVPLVLELSLDTRVDEVVFEGEVATLAPLPRATPVEHVAIEAHPEVAHAHLDFYDAHYFAQKREGDVTRKYRKHFAQHAVPAAATHGTTRVVDAGIRAPSLEATMTVATLDGVAVVPAPCAALVVTNEVAFAARYDGGHVALTWDRAALDARARAIESRWRTLTAARAPESVRGALWYLTKYFTPHPAGEPHFFTKPASFVVTPSGWSSLIEGAPGRDDDVLRGVVHTDGFHATPAVFGLHTGRTTEVPEGRVVARVFPVPRSMLEATVIRHTFEEVLPP
jgi:hypothetical protein